MSLKAVRAREWLAKRRRHPKKKYPMATVAFYGPTDAVATKLAAALLLGDDQEPEALERWILEDEDVRRSMQVTLELVDWLKSFEVQNVVMVDRIIGCPHEEGIDYPDGEVCPACPFWRNRDRFTGELLVGHRSAHSVTTEADEPTLIHSPHCQRYVHEGAELDVHIYRMEHTRWTLEVVDKAGTSTVWGEEFDTDDEAFAEFARTLREEGLGEFEA